MSSEILADIDLNHLIIETNPEQDSYATILTKCCCLCLGCEHPEVDILASIADLICHTLKLFDDVIDDDIEYAFWFGQSKYINSEAKARGTLVNLGTTLFAQVGEQITKLFYQDKVPHQVIVKIQEKTFQSIAPIIHGQQASILVPNPTLETALRIAELKSGHFYGLVCWNAAYFSTHDVQIADKFFEFGKLFGMIVQIANDMSDICSHQGNPSDLEQGNWSLPIAYTLSVLPETEKNSFSELLIESTKDANCEAMAREQIIQSGAFLYWQIENQIRFTKAKDLLNEIIQDGSQKTKLIKLMEYLLTVTPQ